jgi:hypothetical protein
MPQGAYAPYKDELSKAFSETPEESTNRLRRPPEMGPARPPETGPAEMPGTSPSGLSDAAGSRLRAGESGTSMVGADSARSMLQQGEAAVGGVKPGESPSDYAKVAPGDYVVQDLGNKSKLAPKYVYSVSNGKVSFKSPIHGGMVTLSANETDPKRVKAYNAIMRQVAAASKQVAADSKMGD